MQVDTSSRPRTLQLHIKSVNSVILVLLVGSASFIKVSRNTIDSFQGTSSSLSQFEGGAFMSPSIYLYISQHALDEEEVQVSNPFELGPAIKFGLLYAVILVFSKAAQVYLGESGLYISSFIAGLADVDAITLSVADLTLHPNGIGLEMAEKAIVLAIISNTLVKGGMVLSLGSRLLRRSIWPAVVGMVLAGSLIAFLF